MKIPWIPLSLVAALASAGGIYYLVQQSKRAAAPLRQEVPVEIEDVIVSVEAAGTVEPENRITLYPPLAGRVDSILVEEGEDVTKGQVVALMSSASRAALLDMAKTEVAENRALLERSYLPTPVFAPVSGTIINRLVVPGQIIGAGTYILEMSDRLIVRANVDETDLSGLHDGMEAEVVLDALAGKTYAAKILRIAHQSKVVNGVNVYQVETIIDERVPELRSGMSSTVTYFIDKILNASVLPAWAATPGSDGTIAVFDERGVPLTLRAGKSDGRVVVVEGLEGRKSVWVPKPHAPGDESERPAGRSPFSPFGGGGRKGH